MAAPAPPPWQRVVPLRVAAGAVLLAGAWSGTHPLLETLGQARATAIAVPVPAVVTVVDHPSPTGEGTEVTVAVNGGTAKVSGLTTPVAPGETLNVVPDPADPTRAWPESDLSAATGTVRVTARVVSAAGLGVAAGAGGSIVLWRASRRPHLRRRSA